eukprot:scaffold564_cov248-Pinguiococcus_pyrenoidosus.AAC.11
MQVIRLGRQQRIRRPQQRLVRAVQREDQVVCLGLEAHAKQEVLCASPRKDLLLELRVCAPESAAIFAVRMRNHIPYLRQGQAADKSLKGPHHSRAARMIGSEKPTSFSKIVMVELESASKCELRSSWRALGPRATQGQRTSLRSLRRPVRRASHPVHSGAAEAAQQTFQEPLLLCVQDRSRAFVEAETDNGRVRDGRIQSLVIGALGVCKFGFATG